MRPLGASEREEAALNERSYRGSAGGSSVDAPAGRVGSGRGRAQRAQLQGRRSYKGSDCRCARWARRNGKRPRSKSAATGGAQLQGRRSYKGSDCRCARWARRIGRKPRSASAATGGSQLQGRGSADCRCARWAAARMLSGRSTRLCRVWLEERNRAGREPLATGGAIPATPDCRCVC